jgi:hypothetical protein
MYVGRIAGCISIFERDLVVITIRRCGDVLGSEAHGIHVALQRRADLRATRHEAPTWRVRLSDVLGCIIFN